MSATLIENWLTEEANEEEMQSLEEWLRADPDHMAGFLEAIKLQEALRAHYRQKPERINWPAPRRRRAGLIVSFCAVAAISALVLSSVLFASVLLHGDDLTDEDAPTAAAAKGGSPRAVVDRWLAFHRTGKRDEASALTTGSDDHQAPYQLPSKRDTGVRVARVLGNQQAAAVVTTSLGHGRQGKRVLVFWLLRRKDGWRINKSDVADKTVIDERLRGFVEAGDMRWDVPAALAAKVAGLSCFSGD